MGLSVAQRTRLAELAREAKEVIGDSVRDDGQPTTFAELEDECVEAGDLLTALMLQESVKDRQPIKQACCPSCDRQGEVNQDEPRVLETDRGEVAWMESAFYCRHCRRSFFPSLG
jgi:hypothetical protein